MLSEDQISNLTLFKEVSGIDNDLLAIELLANHNWDVSNAITSYSLHGDQQDDEQLGGNQDIILPDETENTPFIRHRAGSNINETASPNGQTPTNRSITPERERPMSVWDSIKWFFSAHRILHNPDNDTAKFIDSIRLRYDNLPLPNLFERSYQAAVRQAFASSKFLLVYLHSEMHDASDGFIRNVLCHSSVSTITNDSFVLWIGSIYDAEAYALTYQLKCKCFPFLTVLMCQSETSVQIMETIQGEDLTDRVVSERLRLGLATYGNAITEIVQRVSRQSDASRLREEQDREYTESMERDRVMREAADQARILRELEQQQRDEQLLQASQQEEYQNALALSASMDAERKMEALREALGDEPADDAATVSLVRFQLPKGGKVSRKFYSTDTIQVVHDYLDVYLYDTKSEVKSFSVSTNYPKRELSTERHVTIAEAGLHPRGMLFVHDLDA